MLKEKVTTKAGKKLHTSRANAVPSVSADTSDMLFGKSVEESDIVE